MKTDTYARVTDRIVADLERGELTWIKPWNAEHLGQRITRPLRANGEPYQGINVILLWAASVDRGFGANRWMTFRQALTLGGHVRMGEKGETVVYADRIVRTDTDETSGEQVEYAIPFMKAYTVFNIEQIDGLPAFGPEPARIAGNAIGRDERLEAFFNATGADIRQGGNRAYYAIEPDYVQMPPIGCFSDASRYYAVLAHEMTHWTRHASRLDRSFGRKRFGDEGYAMEELVAEIGAAFACAELGITPEVREDHAAYIESWLKVLQNDKRAIFTAASYAQRAFEYLLGPSPAARNAEPELQRATQASA